MTRPIPAAQAIVPKFGWMVGCQAGNLAPELADSNIDEIVE